MTTNPRIAAMGDDFLTIKDNDLSLASTNPSLITPEMHQQLNVNYVDFYSGIHIGEASYGRHFDKLGSFTGHAQYVSYGNFDGADATGERTGRFYAGETAIGIGWGRSLDSLFSIGANLSFVYSSFESYNAYGLVVDVAGSYTSADGSFTASLIASNTGTQLKSYSGNGTEPLPFELQAGLSKRLQHLPFRYSVLFNHLTQWNLRYEDPLTLQIDPITGEKIESSGIEKFADNLMRHIVLGGELLIGKNISVRAGYNYKRRQEMKIESRTATVGFSWGFGIRISKFRIAYARSAWHLAGSPNYISISTNLSDFYRKQQ
ncbi:MAG: type IX secretion system protein PorQ [Bacteroidales bacterium]